MRADPRGLTEEVVRRIEAVTDAPAQKLGDGKWKCQCPAHADRSPSLEVSAGDHSSKGVLFHCWEGGCTVGAIAEAIGLKVSQFFYEHSERIVPIGPDVKAAPILALAHIRGWQPDAVRALGAKPHGAEVLFPMYGPAGTEVGWRRRRGDGHKFASAPGRKPVKALTVKGGKLGVMRSEPFPANGAVIVCEGEADAVAALSAGAFAVVATPGGNVSRGVRLALQKLLAGRQAILAPHPDETGRKWRDAVGEALLNVQATVRYVPPAAPHGEAGAGDLDDELKRAEDPKAALAAMIAWAMEWVAPKGKGGRGPSCGERLMGLVRTAELFRSPDGRLFARVPADQAQTKGEGMGND